MIEFPFNIIPRSEIIKLEDDLDQALKKIRSLEAQKGLAGAVLNSMTEAVLAVDKNGRLTLANPAMESIFSVMQPEVLNRTVRESIRNNEVADIVDKALKTGQTVKEEIDIVTPFQASFIVHASPIKDSGVVCVLHDITELKKLERYRSEFVANVSHELKTPITAVRNYVETLLSGAIADKEHNVEFLKKIDKHAHNLSALIDDLLEISELESRKDLGTFADVDLCHAISHAVDTIMSKAKKKNIAINRTGEKAGCLVSGIEDHITRAILNLLDNAVNYTGEGGVVEISCLKNADKIEISVKDNGIGIQEEHIPRIFERFYRVDKGRSRDEGGTGLGLAIVKHVMNVHNGTVSVESTPGKGSKFTLVFPGR